MANIENVLYARKYKSTVQIAESQVEVEGLCLYLFFSDIEYWGFIATRFS